MYWATLILAVVPPQGATSLADAKASSDHPQRAFHEIERDMRDLFKKEAITKDKSKRAQAVYKMTKLYRELMTDPRLPLSDTLASYRIQLWSRMTRVKKEVQRDLLRKTGKRVARRAKGRQGNAQMEAALSKEATLAIADHFSLVGYSMGGPANVFTNGSNGAGRRGGAAVGPDWGQDLVELIESTIQPDFWEANGGPGSIFYFQPLHALVVRATAEMHHKIGGTVKALRRAGM